MRLAKSPKNKSDLMIMYPAKKLAMPNPISHCAKTKKKAAAKKPAPKKKLLKKKK